jgi:hypothetical protein
MRRISIRAWMLEHDLLAARYYWLPAWQRALLALFASLTLLVSIYTLYVSLSPLYSYRGLFIDGYIGITRYKLILFGQKPVRAPPLDSVTQASFALILGSVLSAALVSPILVTSFRRRIPRIYVEAAIAGYTVAGLTLALLHSFLRLLYLDIVPLIPRGAGYATDYGSFSFHGSTGWYTHVGLLTLRLWNYVPIIVAALIAAAGAAMYLLLHYYEELLDTPPRIPHGS